MCMLKPTATPVSPSRFRTRLGSAFLKCVSDGHAWRWRAGIFCAAFVVLLTVALHIVGATLPAGDEPWYLLQGYGIWHFHSPNLALAVRDHSIYRQFLGNLPDDHTHDFVGNGERVLAYLPGYAAIIGWLYAWGGRPLIAGTQALLAVLVYDEALRLYASRGVAVFAASAYVMSLPVLVYAGEIFPTTFALVAAFVGYLLVARVLPAATGRRCILAGLSLGLIAGALPWLHTKYGLIALVLPALGLIALLARTGRRETRATWYAATLIVALPALSFALIMLYSRHYFGTWYPQYRTGSGQSFGAPNLGNAGTLFQQMFLDAQAGLLSWVPLDILAPIGLILLAQRMPRRALLIVACLVGLLGMFLSLIVAGRINEAYAFPARFTVESSPFLALCVAGVFATGEPAFRRAVSRLAMRLRRRELLPATWKPARLLQVGLALACLTLLAFGAWLAAVPQLDPQLLYPSEAGQRLTYKYPHLLPAGWFALFPESPGIPVYSGAPHFDSDRSHGIRVYDAQGTVGYLAAPGGGTESGTIAETVDLRVPPGRYEATFTITCDPVRDAAATFTVIALREPTFRDTPVSARVVTGAVCQGTAARVPVRFQFTSDGYRLLALAGKSWNATTLTVWSVTFGPAPRAATGDTE